MFFLGIGCRCIKLLVHSRSVHTRQRVKLVLQVQFWAGADDGVLHGVVFLFRSACLSLLRTLSLSQKL